jgi:hypothetical protein
MAVAITAAAAITATTIITMTATTIITTAVTFRTHAPSSISAPAAYDSTRSPCGAGSFSFVLIFCL